MVIGKGTLGLASQVKYDLPDSEAVGLSHTVEKNCVRFGEEMVALGDFGRRSALLEAK
jgi:hypothetical protein